MQLTIENISHNGEGVARNTGKVVFIPYAIPGEIVEIDIVEHKKNYSRGMLIEVIDESPDRITASCPHYYQCGGCSYQHINYGQQLLLKQKIVRETAKRIGDVKLPIMSVIGMKNPWHYRNKVIWHVSENKYGKKMGFYHYRSRKLVEISNCPLLMPGLNSVSFLIKEMLDGIKLTENSSIMVRQSNLNKEILVEFINCSPDKNVLRKLSREVQAVYEKRKGKTRLLCGRVMIKEKAGNCIFYLGADDFFQVNSVQTEYLLETVIKKFKLSGYEKILDAYCGVGMFSLNIASSVSSVTGIDLDVMAIKHAKINTELNKIANCRFISGRCEKIIPEINTAFDGVLVDPPRTGLRQEVIGSLILFSPKTIIYVSCNTGTLARDLKQFVIGGYHVVNIQPIDMFPQTTHIENVVLLQRGKTAHY